MSRPRRIDVHLLPALVELDQLAGQNVVVIDVLRATTTIIYALASGAIQVIPCLEVDEARLVAAVEVPGSTVLGGERGGLPIPGFGLGNSPREYTRQRVGGKTVVFTTTNGTRALLRCKAARRVLIGAFVNHSAICRELADEADFALLCAGTDGQVTREDALFAGAVVHELAAAGHTKPSAVPPLPLGEGRGEGASIREFVLNDQAELAADAWRSCIRDNANANSLGQALRASRGGRNLIETGQESDIDVAAQIDKFDLVPELDLATWRIRA
jgi:2-phosphosulfolactate phosphatase